MLKIRSVNFDGVYPTHVTGETPQKTAVLLPTLISFKTRLSRGAGRLIPVVSHSHKRKLI